MPRLHSAILPKTLLARSHEKRGLRVSQAIVDPSPDAAGVYAHLHTRAEGLRADEATARLAEHVTTS
jgi:hypothetical protein